MSPGPYQDTTAAGFCPLACFTAVRRIHQSVGLERMTIIDNINSLLGDDLQQTLRPDAKLKIAASCFSIYAYEALKSELAKIKSLEFIFTAPTFIPDEVTDKLKKEHREFFIPKTKRESSLYGTEVRSL